MINDFYRLPNDPQNVIWVEPASTQKDQDMYDGLIERDDDYIWSYDDIDAYWRKVSKRAKVKQDFKSLKDRSLLFPETKFKHETKINVKSAFTQILRDIESYGIMTKSEMKDLLKQELDRYKDVDKLIDSINEIIDEMEIEPESTHVRIIFRNGNFEMDHFTGETLKTVLKKMKQDIDWIQKNRNVYREMVIKEQRDDFDRSVDLMILRLKNLDQNMIQKDRIYNVNIKPEPRGYFSSFQSLPPDNLFGYRNMY